MKAKENSHSSSSVKNYVMALIVVVAVVALIAYIVLGTSSQQYVKAGDNVSVYYTGSFTNGTVFGSNFGGAPLNFTVGAPYIIPGLSSALLSMKVGQTKNVTIPMQDAYGQINQSKIINVPRNDFNSSAINIGSIVSASSGGQGEIIALNNTTATVNFNSPLAGHTLEFEIKVAAIRK